MKSCPHDGLQRDGAASAVSVFWLVAIFFFGLLTSGAMGSVVINEIMYHPPNDLEELQYIELFNADSTEADLSGWSFSKGVKFSFAPGTKVPSGGFLVVCRNRTKFVERYGHSVPLAGEFEGHLSHNGEQIELSDRDKTLVDAVNYNDSAPWPMAADGRSSSLERICPAARSDDPANWAASELPEFLAPGGTPGKVNDSFSSNMPPAIDEVKLSPAKPSPGQSVGVSALVSDTDGVNSVTLSFRVATSDGALSDETSLQMKRVSGDAHSGRYEAMLPAQSKDRLVRYRIRATDASGTGRSSPDANDLRLAWSYSTFENDNASGIPFGILLHLSNRNIGLPMRYMNMERSGGERSRGGDAFIYLPPRVGEVQLFDFVNAPPRNGGFKVHFRKDETLRGMTSINVIFEGVPRRVLAEPLSYEVYRLAGVPAELTEHIRMWIDGKPFGYHLLIEQPNKAFLARNKRDTTGNLYKLLWYGDGVIGKHEKKTNLGSGHRDLLSVIEGLERTRGTEQWPFIQQHFNVEECINYFAVNMCIQNWDGFHNNYFAYHDTGDTGRWEIYPWDEDKTWGDYDGASTKYDWYGLPLTFGMSGSQPPVALRARGAGGAGGGFVEWWREPGFFSGPLLANPDFRRRFLVRLRDICTSVFTEERIYPLIDEMEKKLGNEVPIRAALQGRPAEAALSEFRANIQSFRDQVIHRRRFVLAELEKR
jgi:hypothetical protein